MTRICMLVFPGLTQLDLTAPFEVLWRLPDASIQLVGESLAPVRSDSGLVLTPDVTLAGAAQADILFVPGGPGVNALLENANVLGFLQAQAKAAAFVTSVCTGSLVLGAAGLLWGYRATTHWLSLEFLSAFGATPVRERVVVDRNRITGGGVTAGLDFALTLAAQLLGPDHAQAIQLQTEYDPAPPFDAGSPARAPASVVDWVTGRSQPALAERRALSTRIGLRLAEERRAR